MRNLVQVIDQMLGYIPSDEAVLTETLKDKKDSVLYSSPEVIPYRWREVAFILFNYLDKPPFSEEWKKKVYNIWMDKENQS